ncbi:alpha/beta-hydrolase [Aspergillus pseudoustus]|uniref:Alpha/beta-hydrolase n=1 Tax=Aspergillus pseudoustus TaxID=1810923 RepID=A0ABR4JUP8_9EURO
MASITPFKISIPDSRLERLRQKLALTDFPEEIHPDLDANKEAETWSRGAPLTEIKRLKTYWSQLPQFTVEIEIEGFGSHTVHFVHQRSKVNTTNGVQKAVPLLFLHGWPGSFIEVSKILPMLVKSAGIEGDVSGPSFHVVAPSLIDFGFSGASRSREFGLGQHAEAYHKLMLALGYSEYVIQSGDLGYLISRRLCTIYGAAHIKALHTNSAIPAEPTVETHPTIFNSLQGDPNALTPFDKAGLARTASLFKDAMGYVALLSTKPQTIGYSLTDSPVGLLAWIHEKLHDWADGYPWSDDEVLTWVCVHYFSTAGPAAPGRLYYALEHDDSGKSAFESVQGFVDGIPLGISRLPKDLIILPAAWNHTLGPVVYQREYERGGHFAAWECPCEAVGDLRGLVARVGWSGSPM